MKPVPNPSTPCPHCNSPACVVILHEGQKLYNLCGGPAAADAPVEKTEIENARGTTLQKVCLTCEADCLDVDGRSSCCNSPLDFGEWESERAGKLTGHWSKKRSRFRGVFFEEKRTRQKWSAILHAQGRQFRLGRFETEEQAARAYDNAVFFLRPGNRDLNFPKDTPANPLPAVKRLQLSGALHRKP